MKNFFFRFSHTFDHFFHVHIYRQSFPSSFLHLLFLMLCTGGWPEDGSAKGGAAAGKERRLFEGGDQWASTGNICLIEGGQAGKVIVSGQGLFNARHICFSCHLPQRLQEAETRNQELSQSVTSATRPLLRQIENLQASLGGQTASWEKLEKSISDRLGKKLEFICICKRSTKILYCAKWVKTVSLYF